MSDVFISYSRRDIDFVRHLFDQLKARDREPGPTGRTFRPPLIPAGSFEMGDHLNGMSNAPVHTSSSLWQIADTPTTGGIK